MNRLPFGINGEVQLVTGLVPGSNWPTSLSEKNLTPLWRVELDSSYSGPIVSGAAVFVTGTAAKKDEVVCRKGSNL